MSLPWNQEIYDEDNEPKTSTTSEGGTFDVWVDPPGQPKKRWWRRVRSSVTGRFAKREEAKTNPDTTVEEKVERK